MKTQQQEGGSLPQAAPVFSVHVYLADVPAEGCRLLIWVEISLGPAMRQVTLGACTELAGWLVYPHDLFSVLVW